MGLKSCEIVFDNPFKTYYVGQTITGHVILKLDSTKKVRGITIQFKGEANTYFDRDESTTDSDGKSTTHTVQYTGHEEYFKIMFYLVGGQSRDSIELPIGVHTYPFTCVLPPTLPSSFEGKHGFIRYTVKVTLDRPWKFDQETKAAFTVLSPVDLNANPRIRDPVKFDMNKYFCCCWCKSGPMATVITIPCTGFVPGQEIQILIDIDNASTVEVEEVKVKLCKIVTYYSQSPSRDTEKDEVKIQKITVGPVAGRNTEVYRTALLVPSLPPSNLTNCGIIDLDYVLKIETVVNGFHANCKGQIPIVIGTVPLQPYSGPVSNIPIGSYKRTREPALGWVIGQDPPSAPPSYKESQFGTVSIQDSNDNEHTNYPNDARAYSPMYPVYNYASTQPSAPPLQ